MFPFILVKSHYTRSYSKNRDRAFILLRQKLDQHLNGSDSVAAREKREASEKKARKRARSRERQAEKRLQKEQTLSESDDDVTKNDAANEDVIASENQEKS